MDLTEVALPRNAPVERQPSIPPWHANPQCKGVVELLSPTHGFQEDATPILLIGKLNWPGSALATLLP